MRIGMISATGPAGQAVALRLASSGINVQLGSRSLEKSSQIIEGLKTAWPDQNLLLEPALNEQAAQNDIVICAAPAEAALQVLQGLKSDLKGKVLISMVNAMTKVGRELHAWIPSRGSMAAEMQALLPETKVSIAFQHLPAAKVADISALLQADVLICSDDSETTAKTAQLVGTVEGLRPLDCGTLANAGPIEQMTAVLVNLNIKYKAHVILNIGGLSKTT